MKRDRHSMAERDDPARLWRIGPAFWPLLPIAVALAAVYFTGCDLQTRLLEWTYALFDVDAVFFVVHRLIIPSGLAFGSPPLVPMFTVLTAWCILVGAAIHVRRFGRWRDVAMLAVGLAMPDAWLRLHGLFEGPFRGDPRMPQDPFVTAVATLSTQTIIAIAGALAAWLLFRARLVALVIIAAGMFGAWMTVEFNWTIAGGELLLSKSAAWIAFAWAGWLFNPAILAASIWWGVSARRAWKPDWACQRCGYDLRAAITAICPECGGEAKRRIP